MKDLHTQYIISHSEEIKLGLSKRYSISARYVWKGGRLTFVGAFTLGHSHKATRQSHIAP